jgi:hypothetical protein
MLETTGYVCSLCEAARRVKRIYASKSSARRHEVSCYRNLSSRACAPCEYWQSDSANWFTCFHSHDMATGESKPIRECEYWKIRAKDAEEDNPSWS